MALCRGAYIGVLDDDDAYAPGFVAALAAALDADPRAGVAFCRTTWEDDGVRVTPADPRPPGVQAGVAATMLRDGWTVSPSHMLFRRDAWEAALRDQPMPSGVAPDAFLNLRVAMAGWAHVLVDAPLVVIRWHPEQLSRRFPAAADVGIATWRTIVLANPTLAALRDRRLARALLVRGFDALRAGDVAGARADVAAARDASPSAWIRARRILAGAAACGVFGVLAARAWSAASSRGRARRRPPLTIGDR